MKELKPCPFCGGEAMIKTKIDHLRGDTYIAQCRNTGCVGRSYRRYPSKFTAMMAWNRRASDETSHVNEH